MGKIDPKPKIKKIFKHLEEVERMYDYNKEIAALKYKEDCVSLNRKKYNAEDAIELLYEQQDESKENINKKSYHRYEELVNERHELLSEAVGISESVTDADGIINVNKLRELIGCLEKLE